MLDAAQLPMKPPSPSSPTPPPPSGGPRFVERDGLWLGPDTTGAFMLT